MPAAMTSTALGPAWFEETMPSVKTDDPAMPSAVRKLTPGGVPLDERDAQDDEAQPDDEERHHRRRAHEREDPVARLVVRELRGNPARRATEYPGQHAHGRRGSHPRHDERSEHAPRGGENDGDAGDERDERGRSTPPRHPARCPGALRPATVSLRSTSPRPARSRPTRPVPPPGASAAAPRGPWPGCRDAGSRPRPSREGRGRRSSPHGGWAADSG